MYIFLSIVIAVIILALFYKFPKIMGIFFSLIVLIGIAIYFWVEINNHRVAKELQNLKVIITYSPEQCPRETPFMVVISNNNKQGVVNIMYKVEAYMDGWNKNFLNPFVRSYPLIIYPKSTGLVCEQIIKGGAYSNIDYKKLNYLPIVTNAIFSDIKGLKKYGKNRSISNVEILEMMDEVDAKK
jgi:hypothetical protein